MEKHRVEIVPMTETMLAEVIAIEADAFGAPGAAKHLASEREREWGYIDVSIVTPLHGKRFIAGYCNYWLVHDEIHLLNVATRATHKRQGHARRLLGHMIQFGHANQSRIITLEVRTSNTAAISLYRSIGWKDVGIRPRYYAETNEDAQVMLLELHRE